MNDGEIGIDIPAKQKQPKSLQSLLAFTSGLAETPIGLENKLDTAIDIFSDELELHCISMCLYEDSPDLNTIFGNQVIQDHSSSKHRANDWESRVEVQVKQLEQDNIELIEEIETIRKQKDEEVARLKDELEREVDRLSREVLEANEKARKAEQGRNLLLSRVGNADSLQVELETLQTELREVSMEKETLGKRFESVSSDSASLKADLQSSKTETNRLKMELSKLKNDYEIAQTDIYALQQEMSANRREVESSEHRLRDVESEKRRLDEQIKSLHNELSDKIQSNNRNGDEIISLERRLAHVETENAAFRRKLVEAEAMERELAQMRRRCSSLDAELQALSAENAGLRASLSSAQAYAKSIPPPPMPSYRVPSYPDSYGDGDGRGRGGGGGFVDVERHVSSLPPPLPPRIRR